MVGTFSVPCVRAPGTGPASLCQAASKAGRQLSGSQLGWARADISHRELWSGSGPRTVCFESSDFTVRPESGRLRGPWGGQVPFEQRPEPASEQPCQLTQPVHGAVCQGDGEPI